jgi:type I restriction enzyme S subunit
MADKWGETTVGELCDQGHALIQTGPFGSQLHSRDYEPVGVPVVPTEAIGHRRLVTEGLPRVSPVTAQRLTRHKLQAGDILFARRGAQATGLSAIVEPEQAGWLCGTGAILLRILTLDLDPVFFSFVLSSESSITWLKTHAVGAVMPNLNETVLRGLPLLLPPLKKQHAIAHILGTLDDKIELNRRMNETLEAMARAIFKSWFVDLDPVRAKMEGRQPAGMDAETAALFPDSFEDSPLGKIPKGWIIGQVHELADLSREALNPGDYPNEAFDHYSIPAFDETHQPKVELGEQIKSNKFVVLADSVLLSKLNPRIPRIWLPVVSHSRRSVCSTEFLVALPKVECTREYLYSLFSSDSFLEAFSAMVTGTSGSHQRVKPEYLIQMEVVIPSRPALTHFSEIVRPLHKQVATNLDQSRTLAAIRDALLPKLLSGEVRVDDLEWVGP